MKELFNLTTPQQNIWNLHMFYENTAIANQCGAVFWDRFLDEGRLRDALRSIVRSNSALRIRIARTEPAKQYVIEDDVPRIDVVHFTDEPALDAYAEKTAATPVTDYDSPLYRFTIFHIDGSGTGVLALLSHVIADAWSFSLLVREVDRIYRNMETADSPASDYRDFICSEAAYRTSSRFRKDRVFWEEKYAAGVQPSLIKPHTRTGRDTAAKRITAPVPEELHRKIMCYCEENGLSYAVLLEAAIHIYLMKVDRDNASATTGMLVLNRGNLTEKKTMGMFVATLPLTLEVNRTETVKELLDRITGAHGKIFRHQKYAYADITKAMKENGGTGKNLYDVMISYQNADTKTGTRTKWYFSGYSEVPLTIHVDNRDGARTAAITLDYQTAVFSEDKEAALMMKRVIYLLEQITDDPGKPLESVKIVPAEERMMLLRDFNDTCVPYDRTKCIHEAFCEQVRETPENTALVFRETRLTYRELNSLANMAAAGLRNRGIGRNDIVAIIAQRDWRVIAAMLGTIKAGGAFLYIDPSYPAERVGSILEDAKPKHVYTFGCDPGGYELYSRERDDSDASRPGRSGGNMQICKSIACEDLGTVFPTPALNQDTVEPGGVSTGDDLCYMVYTSGSTGKPKGLGIYHRNVVNYCLRNPYNPVWKEIREEKKLLSITNMIFDIFIMDLFVTLTRGMTIILADEEECTNPSLLSALCKREKPDVVSTTPSKLKLLMDLGGKEPFISGLQTVILGGEPLLDHVVTQVREVSGARIFNNYGPAETTVYSTIAKIESAQDIHIGTPIANTQIYILDPNGELLPAGAAGELCIGGDGVGAGYLNLPLLTAQKFVDNPFYGLFEGHGRKMYHTGDLAKWRADGKIDHLGRIDTQVKIRGLRIELGEIESGMSEFPGIGICAAAAKKATDGRQYLVGYYLSEMPVDEKELRKHLSRKLAQYMVPNFFVRLGKMPMTPSGKIDRKALPDVEGVSRAETEYVAPQMDTEKKLCAIAEEILGGSRIGAADNFFEAGGDSLGAVAYVAKAHEQGITFKLQDVFDYPTVRELAEHVERSGAGAGKRSGEIPGADRSGAGSSARPTAGRRKALNRAQFTKYEALLKRNMTGETAAIPPRSPGNIFLTGATGFLGAHILRALLEKTNSRIYCLVRGGDPGLEKAAVRAAGTGETASRSAGNENADGTAAADRLLKQLHWYFGDIYDDLIGDRIIPVFGDLETMGSMETELPDDVGTVIHTAATVKHYGPYEYFDRINVEGTKNVIAYASRTGAKLIHISTISVSGNTFADAFDIAEETGEITFDETCLYEGQPLGNVYVRSKFEAERLVLDAVFEGEVSATIVRVGNLTNRTGDYRFQPNYGTNSFLGRMKALLELGLFPDYLMPLYAEFSPVDLTGEGIVLIAQYAGDEQTVFHLYSDRPLYFDRMIQKLRGMGIQMETVDADRFRAALEKTMSDPERNYIYERLQNDLDQDGRLLYDSRIHVKNEYTMRFLGKLGFSWIDASGEYLRGYIDYFRKLGYFQI